ncbi:MAG: hypothetical protein HC878_00365 [Leptolyngbyaceae cyanobacterium SL_5_14]|nr:hypothetical protein [Leptolyngbyaceae cyanobacterium SL_5_14]
MRDEGWSRTLLVKALPLSIHPNSAIAMQTRGLSPLFLREVRQSSEKCVSPVCLVPAPRASYSGVAA